MNYKPHTTIYKNKEVAADRAAQWFALKITGIIEQRGKAVIVVPTGSSPKRFYEVLAADYRDTLQWDSVYAFSLDELVGLPDSHPALFRTYMDTILFSKVNLPGKNIVFLNSTAEDIEKESIDFEKKLRTTGGIDICILGVGSDGHIGMNFPYSPFTSTTRKVLLPAHSRPKEELFNIGENIPSHGITIGIATILSSRNILLLADGESKKQAIENLVAGEQTEKWPVTALQAHPGVQVFVSDDAVSEKVASPC